MGLDLDDSSPDDAIVGWPLALALIGGAGVVVSLLPGVRPGSLGLDRIPAGGSSDGADQAPPPPPPPPPAAPPAP